MFRTRRLVLIGLLVAFSIVLETSFAVPIIPAAPYLLYSPGDLPILFIAYLFGFAPGLIAVGIKAVVFVLIRPPDPVPLYGLLMHFLASSAFVSVFYFFSRKKKVFHVVLGLALGTLARALVMVPANIFLTPYYLSTIQAPPGWTMEQYVSSVRKSIWPVVIPFNLIHSGANSVLFFLMKLALGDRLSSYLFKKDIH
ncbi:ECF transporter S component [bacterium]|nr:ECF transporter S component [bacterium]